MVNDDEITFEKIREELEAYNSYKDGARKVKDAHAKEVMNDIADEELVHAGELSRIVEEVNPEAVEKVKEGYEEAKNVKKTGIVPNVDVTDDRYDDIYDRIEQSYHEADKSSDPISVLLNCYNQYEPHTADVDAIANDNEALQWLREYWNYVRSNEHGNQGSVADVGGFSGFANTFYNPKDYLEYLTPEHPLANRLKTISGRYMTGGNPTISTNKSASNPQLPNESIDKSKVKKNMDNITTNNTHKDPFDSIPSFESMMKYHDENNDKLKFEKSGGGTMTMNRTGISYLGTGKRWNGLYRVHDAVRDSETGQFTIKSTEVEGCTKKEVNPKISAHENTSTEVTKSEVPEVKTEAPKTEIKKSTNWLEML